ncbi:MAG: hypothetical protein M3Z46_00845 [Actinomycetota bacterium]|nr:hypothetical protein [Actinomycetota bacterium]
MRKAIAVAILLVSFLLAGPVGAAPHGRHGHHPHRVRLAGTWVNPTAQMVVATRLLGPDTYLNATGGTDWHGSLEGSTQYDLRGVFDSKTFVGGGALTETFTGRLASGAEGLLLLDETFHFATDGSLEIVAHVETGTGAFKRARGEITFIGHSDANGVGSGTYAGTLRFAAQ